MKKTLLSLALATAALAGAANAAPVYPVLVDSADQNGTIVDPTRSVTSAVIGPADGLFYSLGLGGNMILDFGVGRAAGPGWITEVTYNLSHYTEIVKIYISDVKDGVWTQVATITNSDAQASAKIAFEGVFRYVKLVDASPKVAGRDGFDVDSISFSPVPVPAAGLMLAGAVAGLGALRRRAKKA